MRHFAEWEPIAAGESGAKVYRAPDGSCYAKCVPATQADSLVEERDRLLWLGAEGIPCAPVVDWLDDAHCAVLVSGTVKGISADMLDADDLESAWPSIADAVRTLHALPPALCPFDRGLSRMHAIASDVVGRGAVHPEFLADEDRGVPPRLLLHRLDSEVAQRLEQEAADPVVCHGDLCLPNILISPEDRSVAGFIDVGRLGTADRHADLALLLANARETWPDEPTARAADEQFSQRYEFSLDPERLSFYLRLDPLTWD